MAVQAGRAWVGPDQLPSGTALAFLYVAAATIPYATIMEGFGRDVEPEAEDQSRNDGNDDFFHRVDKSIIFFDFKTGNAGDSSPAFPVRKNIFADY